MHLPSQYQLGGGSHSEEEELSDLPISMGLLTPFYMLSYFHFSNTVHFIDFLCSLLNKGLFLFL